MTLKRKKSYVPDLTVLAALGQANYARLQKLVRETAPGTLKTYTVSSGSHSGQRISVRIEESHKYTTMLKVSQQGAETHWLAPPVMQVRMYHDARMAEVVGYQNEHVREGCYDYPNERMRLPDEKTQLNRFLADWLEHCLKFGRTIDAPCLHTEHHQMPPGEA